MEYSSSSTQSQKCHIPFTIVLFHLFLSLKIIKRNGALFGGLFGGGLKKYRVSQRKVNKLARACLTLEVNKLVNRVLFDRRKLELEFNISDSLNIVRTMSSKRQNTVSTKNRGFDIYLLLNGPKFTLKNRKKVRFPLESTEMQLYAVSFFGMELCLWY